MSCINFTFKETKSSHVFWGIGVLAMPIKTLDIYVAAMREENLKYAIFLNNILIQCP